MASQHLSDPSSLAESALFEAEVQEFREVLARNRSTIYLRVFDYLVAASDEQRSPKEIEIAVAVFGKGPDFDPSFDSVVRVHIHRLRQKMDKHYAGTSGYRLELGKGAYRILLSKQEERPVDSIRLPWQRKWRFRGGRWAIVLGSLAAAELILCAVLLVAKTMQPAAPLARTTFWRPVAKAGAETTVVLGDNYAFIESEDEKDASKLIIDDTIRSRKDLSSYTIDHPEDYYRYYDFDLHYMPTGTASALWKVNRTIMGLTNEKPPTVLPASRLSEEALESGTLLYIGRLQAMGMLSYRLANSSGFRIDTASGRFIDRASGKHYAADLAFTDGSERKDLGYLAVLPARAGARTLVVGGTSDNAVVAMADLAGDARALTQLAQETDNADAFEALYRVTSVGSARIGATALVRRPLIFTPANAKATRRGPDR